MKRLALWLMAAVLCLTGACAEQGGEQSKLTAVVEATAAETGIVMQTPEVTPRLVWDENGPMDTEAPQIGKTKMPLNLRRAAEDPANADALFPVEIQVFWEVEPYFRYEGRTMDEWRAQPALEVYRTASDVWREDVYPELDEKMKAAEARGDADAQGWEKHDPQQLFDVYWEETQPEDVKAAYRSAREAANEAQQAYDAWLDSDALAELETGLLAQERDRLAEHGVELNVSGHRLTGNLTAEQLTGFPAGQYGYVILWAGHENAMDD